MIPRNTSRKIAKTKLQNKQKIVFSQQWNQKHDVKLDVEYLLGRMCKCLAVYDINCVQFPI